MTASAPPRQTQNVGVYRAEHLRVMNGANLGDGLSPAEDLMLDIYRLSPIAKKVSLGLVTCSEPPSGSPTTARLAWRARISTSIAA